MPIVSSTSSLPVTGLRAPAEIRIDAAGIPHLRAASQDDLFLVQGFNAARDRLWQIDLWRKRGLGLLAADFGPGYLAQDRASRLFLYRGDMSAEWAAYHHPRSREIAEAFVAGINAYVDLVDEGAVPLPPEFTRMDTRPARWAAEDVVRIRTHALVRNSDSELARALVLRRADAATDALRRVIDPFRVPEVPPGLALDDVCEAALDDFRLACAPVSFTPERLGCTLAEADRWRKVDALGDVVADPAGEGSNNWAVAGHRTATGRPLMASDPHRAYTLPSLRYLVHLDAPGLSAIGAGEPMQPGVSLGHNGHIAYSLTILNMDQEDVYVYETHPDDPLRHRYGDGWEAMRVVHETVPVRGEAAQTVALHFTRHGPVTHADPARRRAYALRTVWTEPGSSAYFNSLGLLDVRDHGGYRAVMARWSVPGVNHLYADTGGHIAHQPAGKWPRRHNWDGLLPVPGDGRYEWDGFRPLAELPSALDPACGFVATANENVLPPGYDAELHLSHEWAEPSRAERIRAVLAAQPRHALADAAALQNDVTSLPAQRLCALLRRVPSAEGRAADAIGVLRDWDGVLAVDSAPAALFEVWWTRFLKPALFAHATPDPVVRGLLAPGDPAAVLAALENARAWFGGSEAARDALLCATLAEAWAWCAETLGEPSTWAWGRLHHATFVHPLARIPAPPAPDVGPLPMAGSGSTVQNASYRAGDFRADLGASVRLVMDVGAWDNSIAINAPGQSGDPASAHYDDLAGRWVTGHYVPLPFSAAAVDAATVSRIELRPR